MKSGHFNFELMLLIVTLIAGISWALPGNDQFFALVWLFLLGVFQLLHSVIIGFAYRNNKKINNALAVYWTGVIIDFVFIFFLNSTYWNKNTPFLIPFVILPLLLAIYLFGITYYFRQKK